MIDALVNRVKLMVGKALLSAVNDTGQIQLVKIQLTKDEVIEDVERVQAYGLTCNPPVDSETLVAFVGGSRDNGVVFAVDSGAWRITGLQSGEVCLYSKFGQKITLNKDGDTVFNDGTDFAVAFTDLKTAFNELKNAYNTHTHVITVTGAVPAAPPTPVTGSAATALPQSAANIDASKVAKVRLP